MVSLVGFMLYDLADLLDPEFLIWQVTGILAIRW